VRGCPKGNPIREELKIMRGEQPWRTNRSRGLRSQPISAEAQLWGRLRNRQLGGHKFVRQMPIDPYFVDFVCRERKVIVEVDGGTHSTDSEVTHDAARTRDLESLGYRVFRISNDDVHYNLDCALDALLAFIEAPR
jgi:very-short-patch-repair endonuclease